MENASELVLVSTKNHVRTLTMNMPKRLNGWTFAMIEATQAALRDAADDDEVKVIILTGTGPYYSAGVNLGGSLQPGHPKTMHAAIVGYNQAVFDAFINVPKPIIAAVNGHAIGASVTTATLCDAIIASDQATFSTPFAKLGVPAEGCSSVQFERLFGQQTADRILGKEGWKPTGAEAAEIGLAERVVPNDTLLTEAQTMAEGWVAEGRGRTYRGNATREELLAINARESVEVATAFLSPPFLKGQYTFLRSKGKKRLAAMFWVFWRSHPLWSRLL